MTTSLEGVQGFVIATGGSKEFDKRMQKGDAFWFSISAI